MNKTLLFFCFSTAILALSLVVVCISPIINNIVVQIEDDSGTVSSWKISEWRTLNCKLYEDEENADNVELDKIQRFRKIKNICNRKKAMHDLEFASLLINLILGFVCANFSLLHYLDVGKDFEKKTGLIGFVTGIVGFIITFVYICYNGYVFNNDIAYAESNSTGNYQGKVTKLFSNGATHKWDGNNKYITPYEDDNSDFSTWAKFKDLGEKQYNYESQFYKTYTTTSSCKSYTNVNTNNGCEYIFGRRAYTSMENKDLYDRWLTTLILAILIVISDLGLLIFGFLLYKSSGDSNEVQTVQIQ
jgi:hypothetical protein